LGDRVLPARAATVHPATDHHDGGRHCRPTSPGLPGTCPPVGLAPMLAETWSVAGPIGAPGRRGRPGVALVRWRRRSHLGPLFLERVVPGVVPGRVRGRAAGLPRARAPAGETLRLLKAAAGHDDLFLFAGPPARRGACRRSRGPGPDP